jgi:hypothetical protein
MQGLALKKKECNLREPLKIQISHFSIREKGKGEGMKISL